MKTGSGNTQAPKEFSEAQKQFLQTKIAQLISDGKAPADILSTLGTQPEYKLLHYPDFLKLVQTVAATMTKSPELSADDKASAGKLHNLVEKKIEEESKGVNKDSKVPTAGNQNHATPAVPTQEAQLPSSKQTHAQKVTAEAAATATNSVRSL